MSTQEEHMGGGRRRRKVSSHETYVAFAESDGYTDYRNASIRYRISEVSDDSAAWGDLKMLLRAIDEGSLSAAAGALGVGQSTASRRIARLEDQLASRLLDRTPDGVEPTTLAERIAPYARAIEEQMAAIARLAEGEEASVRGLVRLAMPDGLASTWLVPRLGSLFDLYPELELELMIGTPIVDLLRREADLALRFVAPPHPDLVVKRAARLPLYAYVTPALRDCTPRELLFVMLSDPAGAYLETQWIQRHASRSRRLHVSNWNALFAAVKEGLGAGILSPLVAEEAGLVRLENVPRVGFRDLLLVYHPASRDVPRINAVREWLNQQSYR